MESTGDKIVFYGELVVYLHIFVSKNIAHIAKIMYFDYNIELSAEDLNKVFMWSINEKLDLHIITKLMADGAKFNAKNIKSALGFAMLENRYDDFSMILRLIINATTFSYNKSGFAYENDLSKVLSFNYGNIFDEVLAGAIKDEDTQAIKLLFFYGVCNKNLANR